MSRNIRVLVVDDDSSLRSVVAEQLCRGDFEAVPMASAREAVKLLSEQDYDVVLLDVMMPDMSGLETLEQIRKLEDPPEVVMLTADTSLSTGIEAMRLGAYHYLTKPATLDEMEAVLRKAHEKRRLLKQNASLRSVAGPDGDADDSVEMIVESAAMTELLKQAEAAARTDSTVLLTGESGTGKDVMARYIHAKSPRAGSPMIMVNCGALPETLIESEFFGHERGAFTGANATRRGLLEAADGSSLFMDEIGDMPLLMQVKVLHFLEQGRFRRVGSTRDQNADVRIIAATNRNLPAEVERQHFRADLYYRLNVVSLHIPPLRERRAAIPYFIDYFLRHYRERFKRPNLDMSPAARAQLQDYSWPGNVRELRNSLERAAALSQSDMLEAAQFPFLANAANDLPARAESPTPAA
ncbi:MAG TPA: sigma-54 dependent transcriptional regulator, partial [Pyrinomonadaceae bacterium]|nr:sigma-54 dependent transcriptional regulator [Pyrinomonadaceae bacterium]